MAFIQRTVCLLSQSLSQLIKHFLFMILCVFVVIQIPRVYAEPTSYYGPTKSGDTLWKIAHKNLSDPSLSVEQFVYSIYFFNPKAFQAGNINQLQRGVMLKLPTTENISKISKPEAKKLITLLQTNAKQLTRAKANSRKFSQRIKKYSKQLRKYRRNSRGWKRVYRKLARSKRNLAVSNRKVARIKKSMTISVDRVEKSQKEINKTNEALQSTSLKKAKSVTNVPKNSRLNASNIQEKKSVEHTKKGGMEIKEEASQKSILEKQKIATNEIKKAQVSPSSNANSAQQKINWFNYASENFILIAGIINAIILLFVLFKLFEKKEEPDFAHE